MRCNTKVVWREVSVIWVWWTVICVVFTGYDVMSCERDMTWCLCGMDMTWHDVRDSFNITSLFYIIYYAHATRVSGHIHLIPHHIRIRPCIIYIRHIRLASHPYHGISRLYQITSVSYQLAFISHHMMSTAPASCPYHSASHKLRHITSIFCHKDVKTYHVHMTSYHIFITLRLINITSTSGRNTMAQPNSIQPPKFLSGGGSGSWKKKEKKGLFIAVRGFRKG